MQAPVRQVLAGPRIRRYHPHDLAPYLTRASAAWYIDPVTGLLTQASSNVARICMSPAGVLSILREPQSTNEATWSADLTNAAFTKGSVTASLDGGTAPDGNLARNRLTETTANNEHICYRGLSSRTTDTFSVFLKAGERTAASLRFYSAGSQYVSVTFNLATGAVTQTSNVGVTYSAVTSGSEARANGWYRCWVNATRASGTTQYVLCLNTSLTPTLNADGGEVYVGDAANGIYAWGYDIQAGAGLMSHIPTAGSTVTRSRDEIVIPTVLSAGQAFSECLDFCLPWAAPNSRLIGSSNSAGDLFCSALPSSVVGTYNGTATVVVVNTFSANTRTRAAHSADASGRAVCLNGGAVVSGVTTFGAISQRKMGQDQSGDSNSTVLYIHEYRQSPQRWSDRQLQGYTA